MAVRNSYLDFQRDIAARSNAATGVVYASSLNSDNVSLKITRNGVTIYSKVLWNAQGSAAQTDAGGVNQDVVTYFDAGSGYPIPGSAQQFINSLV